MGSSVSLNDNRTQDHPQIALRRCSDCSVLRVAHENQPRPQQNMAGGRPAISAARPFAETNARSNVDRSEGLPLLRNIFSRDPPPKLRGRES